MYVCIFMTIPGFVGDPLELKSHKRCLSSALGAKAPASGPRPPNGWERGDLDVSRSRVKTQASFRTFGSTGISGENSGIFTELWYPAVRECLKIGQQHQPGGETPQPRGKLNDKNKNKNRFQKAC